MSPPPRRLSFAVGTSLLTASLSLGAAGCDGRTVNPVPEKSNEKQAKPEPDPELAINPGPEPEPEPTAEPTPDPVANPGPHPEPLPEPQLEEPKRVNTLPPRE
jgi:outer membrane biosynthesis protein TonB